jgi:Ala-tRNA(Pro) deacylase
VIYLILNAKKEGKIMQLRKGHPALLDRREEKEIKVYNLLEQLKIPYEQADHEAASTMEACERVDELMQVTMCKNLFLCNRQQTDFYLLLMPGNKKFKTKDLSKQIGSARLSFAGPEFMEKFLNISPGSVSVLGLMNDLENRVQLLVDEEVLEDEFIGCHPCVNTSSLKLLTKDLTERFLPAVHHEMKIVHLPNPEEE